MRHQILSKTNSLLHGGDYNPDQWLDRPDILKKDIELMKKAHVNCVSVDIFGWATLEPEEGRYEFDWLRNVMDSLYEAGIYTILATPSGAMPHWLTETYPEVLQTRENGQKNLPGVRHNFCYTSPVMREKVQILDAKLASEFGNHKGLLMWHISNELGGNDHDASCHCELCQAAFRVWLQEKYQTLDALNHAWWTKFWSHTYTDWNQIHSPVPNGECRLHGLNLDWKRFVSDRLLNFYRMEYDTVKQGNPEIPVTTNFMEYFKPLDYFKFQKDLDLVSWDSYPNWHSQSDDVGTAVYTAACHNMMRSIKKAPFLLMESTPSLVNWKPYNMLKRPGMHLLSSMQAVAHGSDGVLYFQWRQSRGSFEKFHGAVVDHYGGEDTRVFADVTEVGKQLEAITEAVSNTINQSKAAIIFDWENWWAVEDAAGPRTDMEYVKTMVSHYRPFWELGIEVDIIDMEQSLDGYQLVVAPMTYMLKAGFAEEVRQFTERGGSFVTTYWSGIVDETDLCFLGGMPGYIRDILGIRWEEIDAPPAGRTNHIQYEGRSYEASRLMSLIRLEGAEELGQYTEDFYAGKPALTSNTYGQGKAYYIASENEPAFLKDFYQKLTDQIGIPRNINTELPYGVTVTKRTKEDGTNKACYFVQNFNQTTVEIQLDEDYQIPDTKEIISGSVTLNPYQCLILLK